MHRGNSRGTSVESYERAAKMRKLMRVEAMLPRWHGEVTVML